MLCVMFIIFDRNDVHQHKARLFRVLQFLLFPFRKFQYLGCMPFVSVEFYPSLAFFPFHFSLFCGRSLIVWWQCGVFGSHNGV